MLVVSLIRGLDGFVGVDGGGGSFGSEDVGGLIVSLVNSTGSGGGGGGVGLRLSTGARVRGGEVGLVGVTVLEGGTLSVFFGDVCGDFFAFPELVDFLFVS